jgi:sialidase-1
MRVLIFLFCFISFAKAQESVVFKSGTEGHKSYRIPAIVTLPTGELLAFAEGRVNNSADFGDINIVMKRSSDKGKTWSDLIMLVDQTSLQAGNPAPVIDLQDPAYPKGVVYLFYNTGNNHENEIRKGNGVREVWFIRSFDLARTWSEPVNITSMVHKPLQSGLNAAYNFKEDWRSYANTPGHAMQFQKGKYKGRIIIPANHSAGPPQPQFRDYRAHAFYSDDQGKTFQLSPSIDIEGSNESIATELSNNRMLMSIRNQRGDIRSRILAYSSTGGEKWDTAYFENQLLDPVCQGSLLTIGYKKGKAIIALSNAADQRERNNLTIKISNDEGKSWSRSILVDKNETAKNDWTAYSDLVLINKKTIGILYERNNYAEIVFKPIKL